jgi:hypothetical protein
MVWSNIFLGKFLQSILFFFFLSAVNLTTSVEFLGENEQTFKIDDDKKSIYKK